MGSLNPDLYRTVSLEAGDNSHTLTFRFELKFLEAKEWLEVNIVRIKGVPKGNDEVFVR